MAAWPRVSKVLRCPVCGQADWCLVAPDGTAAICGRIEEGCVKYISGSGYLHKIDPDGSIIFNVRTEPGIDTPKPGWRPDGRNWEKEAAAYESFAWLWRDAFGGAVRKLGLLEATASDFRWGWCPDTERLAMPMMNSEFEVIGIRMRNKDGTKRSILHSANGLHLPTSLKTGRGSRVLLCEGPTDAVALASLGCQAIGRPSCFGGEDKIVRLLVRMQKRLFYTGLSATIVADNDGPGQAGAKELQGRLDAAAICSRIITLPGNKDARDWVRAGGTREELLRITEA